MFSAPVWIFPASKKIRLKASSVFFASSSFFCLHGFFPFSPQKVFPAPNFSETRTFFPSLQFFCFKTAVLFTTSEQVLHVYTSVFPTAGCFCCTAGCFCCREIGFSSMFFVAERHNERDALACKQRSKQVAHARNKRTHERTKEQTNKQMTTKNHATQTMQETKISAANRKTNPPTSQNETNNQRGNKEDGQQTTNNKQQTANSKQQTTNTKHQTPQQTTNTKHQTPHNNQQTTNNNHQTTKTKQ